MCGAELWEVLLYENDKGKIKAAMPIHIPCKGVIAMPPFTQSMGIWFKPAKKSGAESRKRTITEYFINQLPPAKSFLVNFLPHFTDCPPFYLAGYTQATRYNYILPLTSSEQLWKNLSENIRRNIQKAHKKFHITIKKDVPVDVFLRLNAMIYARQKKKTPSPWVLKNVIEQALKRQQGAIWGAYDAENNLHAAVFVVWQSDRAYYIAAGVDTRFRHSGAQTAALWQAIQEVSVQAKTFDFCGSMIPGIAHFFQQFGATQTPYFAISKGKMSLWLQLRAKFNKMRKKRNF